MVTLITVLLLSYLIGSIPTSIIVGRIARGIDIRDHGSGNAGATNVYRVLGLRLALLVFGLDAGKAAATVLLVTTLRIDSLPLSVALFRIMTGLALIIGNIWPVFAGFAGGKGVTTSTGIFMALTPLATGCALLVWLAVVSLTRYVSIGSIAASLTLPIVVSCQRFLFHSSIPDEIILFTVLIPPVIIATHFSNIKRLFSGTERRIGFTTKENDAHPT